MNDIEAALQHFRKVDPVLFKAGKRVQKYLEHKPFVKSANTLFASLAESVVSQQLSVKASDTIFARLKNICGGVVSPESVHRTSLSKLRKAGLSAAKAKTLKALAKEVKAGLNLPALLKVTKEEATERLTRIWGVGPWTAEMFLMFGLHHPDIFSARDLGLVRAMEMLYGCKNPSMKKLEAIAIPWSPYRTVACRILWKTRDGKNVRATAISTTLD